VEASENRDLDCVVTAQNPGLAAKLASPAARAEVLALAVAELPVASNITLANDIGRLVMQNNLLAISTGYLLQNGGLAGLGSP
jgi:tRNA A37 threonylcarbamoyltransferase TsaD